MRFSPVDPSTRPIAVWQKHSLSEMTTPSSRFRTKNHSSTDIVCCHQLNCCIRVASAK